LIDLPELSGGGRGEWRMLYYALVFFVLALVAGAFGFGLIASTAVGIAKILFFLFLVLFVVSLVSGGFRRGTTT
jgi:uncharacterized membrane protein YtjA (UPF0391 family)